MVVTTEAGPQPSSVRKYQVFLSFRGKDTRKNFTDHLYAALLQAQIHTFKDEHALERGKNIGNELQKAIRESEIALVVFSRNYAESKWCLDELVGIMERNETTGLIVIPVFYDVQPSHVRFQTDSFGEAFSRHENYESKEKIDLWKAALRQAADLGGMVLQNEADGYESKFIQEIVQNIKTNLKRPNPNVNPVLASEMATILLAALGIMKYLVSNFFRFLNYCTKPRSFLLHIIGHIVAQSLGVGDSIILLYWLSLFVGWFRCGAVSQWLSETISTYTNTIVVVVQLARG